MDGPQRRIASGLGPRISQRADLKSVGKCRAFVDFLGEKVAVEEEKLTGVAGYNRLRRLGEGGGCRHVIKRKMKEYDMRNKANFVACM